jgi:hypothetical protein
MSARDWAQESERGQGAADEHEQLQHDPGADPGRDRGSERRQSNRPQEEQPRRPKLADCQQRCREQPDDETDHGAILTQVAF